MEVKRKRGEKKEGYKNNDPKYIEYYNIHYPDWSIEKKEHERSLYIRSCNYQCIEYYNKKYPGLTQEQRLQLLEERKRSKKIHHPNNIEYYRHNYPELSEEECQTLLSRYSKENNCQCIEYYKKRYPKLSEEEQQRLLEIAKLNYRHPDITGVNNPSHKSKTTDKQRKERSVMCIEYYEKKYPLLSHEEHLKLKDEKIKYVKERHRLHPSEGTTVESWMKKGLSEEEARQKVKERCTTNGLQWYIKRYGEIEGKIKYANRISRWQDSLHKSFINYGDNRSCQSSFAVNIISKLCETLDISIPKKEKFLSWNNSHFAYDFNYKKKIIEFNGDYWHCNPSLYKSDFFNKSIGKYAKDIWEKDENKRLCAINNGYKILTIWELDYNQNPDAEFEKCLKFIYE